MAAAQNPHKKRNNTRATAQEPQNTKPKIGSTWKMATINVRGMITAGKREEIEKWMKENNIVIAVIQETRIKHNTREARKNYTWYFSGEQGRQQKDGYTAGVGIVISNKQTQHIKDIEPISDRLMYITLKGNLQITIINTHIPAADRPQDEKYDIYKQISQLLRKRKNKGPTYLAGDMNARIQKAQTDEESRYIGEHTFEPDTEPGHTN